MKKLRAVIIARCLIVVTAIALVAPLAVGAANITSGSVSLGDPRPSQTTSYTFSGSGFSTGTTIRCIQLRLNTAADGSGSVPTGVTTTGSSLSSSTLITAGSWTVGNGVNGSLRITNAGGATPSASGNVVWGSVVSGSAADTTYYGLFNTYTNTDCSTGPVDATVVAFVYKDGALASLIVDPSLTFTITGVASGQTVNGATTNISTTPTAINFARTPNVSTKGVSAHTLDVASNAGGFTVHLRQTGTGLSNGTHDIAAWTGTNGSPTTFPAAGTEAWGYTTEDSSLAGGTANRFTTASNWAGMPTVNGLVMDNPSSGTQQTKVGHQLGVASTTPAGNYSTTLVYTAAGIY